MKKLTIYRNLTDNWDKLHPEWQDSQCSMYFRPGFMPEDEIGTLGLENTYPAWIFEAQTVEEFLAGLDMLTRDADDFDESTLESRLCEFRESVEQKGLLQVIEDMKAEVLPCRLTGETIYHRGLQPIPMEDILKADVVLYEDYLEEYLEPINVEREIRIWQNHLNGNVWMLCYNEAFDNSKWFEDDCDMALGTFEEAIEFFKEEFPEYREYLERGDYDLDYY